MKLIRLQKVSIDPRKLIVFCEISKINELWKVFLTEMIKKENSSQLQELVCLVCNLFNFSSNCDYDYDLILVSRNFVKTMLCYNELFSSSM